MLSISIKTSAKYHALKQISIWFFFLFSLRSTFLLYALREFIPIFIINNLLKSMYSKDMNCSRSPYFIELILFWSKNKLWAFLHKFNIFRFLKLSACSTSALQSSSSNQPQRFNKNSRRWFQLLRLRNCFKSNLDWIQPKSE